MRDEEIAEILKEQSEEYKKLYMEHKNLDNLLAELNKKRYLTPDEELEKKNLQKQKLFKKDSMASLIREYKNKLKVKS